MKKIIPLLITCLALCFCCETTAIAQTTQKIATINLRKVFDGYFKTKQADIQIKELAAGYDAENKKYQDEYKKLTDDYSVAYAKIDDPTITEEVKAQRRAAAEDLRVEIKKLETMITQFERSARTALSEQQRRYRKNIMEEITELVAKRAKSEQYSMVFDVGADSADRSRILLYTDGQYDLTEDILKQLNANAPADILEKMKEEPIESEEP
ncbi:MAG: OmpH family outer membrane protein [Verrucomicrobia bacterium]|nr:OmpH family outer membrane protein [Verrucomicrobiota bacterium]